MLAGVVKHTKLVIMVTITFFMIYSGACKLVDFPGWPEQFQVWGYNNTIMYIVATIEIIIACLIFAKPTRIYGCIALVVLMTGAIYTHLSHYENEEIYTASLIIFGCAAVLGLEYWEQKLYPKEL